MSGGYRNVFPVQSIGGSGTSVHNDLTGIQGGQASQYYHLTQAQYLALVTFLAGGAGTPVVSSVVIDFGNEMNKAETVVVDATITAKTVFYIDDSNEDLLLQGVRHSIVPSVGVGYTIDSFAPNGASGQYTIKVIKQESL